MRKPSNLRRMMPRMVRTYSRIRLWHQLISGEGMGSSQYLYARTTGNDYEKLPQLQDVVKYDVPATLEVQSAHPCLSWRSHTRKDLQAVVPAETLTRRATEGAADRRQERIGGVYFAGTETCQGRRGEGYGSGRKFDVIRSRETDRCVYFSLLFRA